MTTTCGPPRPRRYSISLPPSHEFSLG
jgi:hypothetical protein